MLSRNYYISLIKYSLTILICAPLMATIATETLAQQIDNCTDNVGIQLGICINTNNDTLNVLVQQQKQEQSLGQISNKDSSSVDAQRSQKTADSVPDPRALAYEEWARCKASAPGTGPKGNAASSTNYDDACPLPPAAQHGSDHDQAPGRQPTTEEILYAAAAIIHADGAGIHKLPPDVSYTNRFIPTIVSVTNPTQTHVINLLGRDITITLTATKYEWNWGDGTPNTVTTSPGLAWEKGIDPNNDPRLIRHYYTPPQGWRSMLDGPYPHENREITLTTTWSGTATNPFTGETQTINGLVTTTETTGPFPLSHLVINNTDTWEEKQGH